MRKKTQNAREVSLISLTLRTTRLYHSMHATENHCSLLKCEEQQQEIRNYYLTGGRNVILFYSFLVISPRLIPL